MRLLKKYDMEIWNKEIGSRKKKVSFKWIAW